MHPMPGGRDYDLQRGDVAAVLEALRGGVPVDARNEYGRSALVVAARDGNAKLVRGILTFGPDLAAADSAGMTALHWAVKSGDGEVVEALLEASADP